MRRLIIILLFAPLLHAAEVRTFAAASLTDALKEIAATYEQRTGDRILFNFGASSTLARQIQEGAPADLFLSADELKMNALDRAGLIDRKSRLSVLSNTLVIVADRASVRSVRDLVNVETIALAEPSSVPAGIYARQYLTRIGMWPRIASKVIPVDNVRAALAAVEAGNADAAIVYRTDALLSRRVRIAVNIARTEGPHISYPFAVTRDAESPAAARRFLAYLTSKPALDVFRRYGFLIR